MIIIIHVCLIFYLLLLSYARLQVQLRGCCGNVRWRGKWSEEDRESWSPFYLHRVPKSALVTGAFWMSFQDFVLRFSEIFSCHVRPNWVTKILSETWRDHGARGVEHCQYVPQFRFVVPSPQLDHARAQEGRRRLLEAVENGRLLEEIGVQDATTASDDTAATHGNDNDGVKIVGSADRVLSRHSCDWTWTLWDGDAGRRRTQQQSGGSNSYQSRKSLATTATGKDTALQHPDTNDAKTASLASTASYSEELFDVPLTSHQGVNVGKLLETTSMAPAAHSKALVCALPDVEQREMSIVLEQQYDADETYPFITFFVLDNDGKRLAVIDELRSAHAPSRDGFVEAQRVTGTFVPEFDKVYTLVPCTLRQLEKPVTFTVTLSARLNFHFEPFSNNSLWSMGGKA